MKKENNKNQYKDEFLEKFEDILSELKENTFSFYEQEEKRSQEVRETIRHLDFMERENLELILKLKNEENLLAKQITNNYDNQKMVEKLELQRLTLENRLREIHDERNKREYEFRFKEKESRRYLIDCLFKETTKQLIQLKDYLIKNNIFEINISFDSKLTDAQLEKLYVVLKGKFIDTDTDLNNFKNIFKATEILSPVKWILIAKNKSINKNALIDLFRLLAEYNFVSNIETSTNIKEGGCLFEKLKLCFCDIHGKNLDFTLSNKSGYSKHYEELEKIIKAL